MTARPCFIELFVTNVLLFEHQQKTARLADSFLEPMA